MVKSEKIILISFVIFAIIYSTQCHEENMDSNSMRGYRKQNRDIVNLIHQIIKRAPVRMKSFITTTESVEETKPLKIIRCGNGKVYDFILKKCVKVITTNGFGNPGFGR